jgi:hypothetical protein
VTRPAHWRGVGVQTVAQLQRKHRRLDHNRRGAASVLTKLMRGQSLNLSFERGERRWRLSNGERVGDDIARIVVVDHRVVGTDTLFKGLPPQTFRFVED